MVALQQVPQGGGVGLQLGTGYLVAYLVYQIGTLISTGSFGEAFVPGLIICGVFVAVLAYLMLSADRRLKAK